jgi:chitin synthase
MGLYAVPILFYSILFCNIRVIFEILLGAVSFTFYSPTYLIILNIYALCRMDDLSWGTKGLEAGGGGDKDVKVLTSWKIIKTIHVAKLVFWNVIVAGLLIHFGSNYLVRFYLTFALMVLIASTMAIKVVLAIMYYF